MIKLQQAKEIEDDIVFDSHDLFNRKSFGEGLANLIQNSENESLVISINAPWGEGKTHFLKMWKNLLKNERSKKVIYFNSFKSDYLQDPFTALLGELIKEFQEDQGTMEKIKDKGMNIMKGIIPLAGKIGARVILGGDIHSIDDTLESLIEGDIIDGIKNTLDEYSKQEDTIISFRNTLEKIIEEKGEIIFIIDELDRCRPDFALKLLERIKHFFNIKGLYFVLGINKKQIESYIVNMYGNIDTTKYLQKFIDIESILPKNTNLNKSDNLIFIERLFNDHQNIFLEKEERNIDSLAKFFYNLTILHEFSLRDIQKTFNYFLIIRKVLGKNDLYLRSATLILIFAKVIDNNFYLKIRNGKITKNEIIDKLNINLILENSYKEYVLNDLSFLFDINLSEELIKKYEWIRNYYYWDLDFDTRKRILDYHFELVESYNIG